jgi:hypothetical protein
MAAMTTRFPGMCRNRTFLRLRGSRLQLTFGLGALAGVSAAQAQMPSVRADVPFDFVVGNRPFPLGTMCWPGRLGKPGHLEPLDRRARHDSFDDQACTSDTPSGKSRLVFHPWGAATSCSQVWAEGHSSSRQLPRSQAEAELAKNREAGRELLIVAATLTR